MRSRRLVVALAGALAAAALAATPAAAGVRIGPDRITVSSGDAKAVVDRDPLRIEFVGGGGRAGLSGVEARPGASTPVPPLPRSQFVTQGPVPPTLHAPFTFLVGESSVQTVPAGQWAATLQTVTEGGVEYGAVAVESAEREGDAVRLSLATSDPSGRRVLVTLGPGPVEGTISVSATLDRLDGVAAVGDTFVAEPGDSFRGFGGRHNAIDQRGTEFYNWVQQQNISSGSADGLDAISPGGQSFLFPNGQHAAYYPQSLMVSERYGFLLDDDELSHWRMASDPGAGDSWQVQTFAGSLDYVVAPGPPRESIAKLTAINGRHRVPPRWALGPILDREVIFQNDPPDKYEQEVRQDLVDMKRYGVRPAAYRIEGWQFLPRPVLEELIAELKRRRIRPMLYFRAFVGKDEIGTDDPSLFDEAIDRELVATRPDGSPYTFVSNFNAEAALIDFTDPEAVRWWQDRVTAALELGAEGFMQDFGEQTQTDMRFDDGSTGLEMHNRLPTLFHRATMKAVRRFERAHPRREIFYYTRAGFSGTPGSARYEFANFPGDETTDWSEASGIASLTPDMLNRAVGGAYGYTTDIGGYFDIGPYEPTTKELFIRWTQWAALSPMFRLHGSVGAGVHMPWTYDAQTLAIYRRFARLHRRAVPLIHRLWKRAKRTGIPVTRPLWLAFPRDEQAALEDQEWMLGPHVLVAPVVQEGATSREVYFPAGCWRSGAGERHRGPATVEVEAPLGHLPFFTRCGKDPLRR